jgi:hypothetical protein
VNPAKTLQEIVDYKAEIRRWKERQRLDDYDVKVGVDECSVGPCKEPSVLGSSPPRCFTHRQSAYVAPEVPDKWID